MRGAAAPTDQHLTMTLTAPTSDKNQPRTVSTPSMKRLTNQAQTDLIISSQGKFRVKKVIQTFSQDHLQVKKVILTSSQDHLQVRNVILDSSLLDQDHLQSVFHGSRVQSPAPLLLATAGINSPLLSAPGPGQDSVHEASTPARE